MLLGRYTITTTLSDQAQHTQLLGYTTNNDKRGQAIADSRNHTPEHHPTTCSHGRRRGWGPAGCLEPSAEHKRDDTEDGAGNTSAGERHLRGTIVRRLANKTAGETCCCCDSTAEEVGAAGVLYRLVERRLASEELGGREAGGIRGVGLEADVRRDDVARARLAELLLRELGLEEEEDKVVGRECRGVGRDRGNHLGGVCTARECRGRSRRLSNVLGNV